MRNASLKPSYSPAWPACPASLLAIGLPAIRLCQHHSKALPSARYARQKLLHQQKAAARPARPREVLP